MSNSWRGHCIWSCSRMSFKNSGDDEVILDQSMSQRGARTCGRSRCFKNLPILRPRAQGYKSRPHFAWLTNWIIRSPGRLSIERPQRQFQLFHDLHLFDTL